MKKQVIIIALLIAILSISGCQNIIAGDIDDKTSGSINESEEVSSYFPFLEDTLLVYEGIGNEFASQSRYFEFIEGNKAQMKVMNSGTNLIRVFEVKDGKLIEVYSEGEFYHIENMMNNSSKTQEVLLKEPLEIGNSWTTGDGYIKEITGMNVSVETPYDSFEAMEITTDFGEGRIQKDYFVKGIGGVARIYEDGETQIKMLLSDIQKGDMVQQINMYYPLKEDMSTVQLTDDLRFGTNDSMEDIMEFKFKSPLSDELLPILPAEVSINSIHLDRTQWIAKVDLTDNFIPQLNAGSSFELEVVNSMVNTIGKLYDTDKVYISLDGRPYESGHIALKDGETFKVDTENIREFNK